MSDNSDIIVKAPETTFAEIQTAEYVLIKKTMSKDEIISATTSSEAAKAAQRLLSLSGSYK